MDTNKCKKCGEVKPMQEFYKSQFSRVSGIGECAECTKARVRANRMANLDRHRAFDRARADHPKRVAARAEYAASERGRQAQSAAKKRYVYADKNRRAAQIAVGNALRDGRLSRLDACEHCGNDGRLQAHHPEYSLPLCVTWLCVPCHAALHKEHRERLRDQEAFGPATNQQRVGLSRR